MILKQNIHNTPKYNRIIVIDCLLTNFDNFILFEAFISMLFFLFDFTSTKIASINEASRLEFFVHFKQLFGIVCICFSCSIVGFAFVLIHLCDNLYCQNIFDSIWICIFCHFIFFLLIFSLHLPIHVGFQTNTPKHRRICVEFHQN